MKPAPFSYARAVSVDHGVELLREAGDEAKLIAGGQSLVPLMAFRLARPSHIIDIGSLKGLSGIAADGDGLRVGALVTHATLERSGLSGPWQGLQEAASLIGHLPIRVRGTFGGSMAHGDPAGELCVMATALDAVVVLRSVDGERTIAAGDFFLGPLMTALESDEILVETRFPHQPSDFRSVFEEFSPRVGDFALASVAAGALVDQDKVVRDVRIALGSVGPTPIRAVAAEQALKGSVLTPAAIAEGGALAVAACLPAGDWHADADYRRALIGSLVQRALRRLGGDS